MSIASLVRSAPARSMIFLIELYRTFISPLRLPTCRFSPTCSEYAVDALTTHGAVKGLIFSTVRIAKCAPWHSGGWDPVPERGRWRTENSISTKQFLAKHVSNDLDHESAPHEPATVDEQRGT